MREVLKYLGGSTAVYVVVVACSTNRLELPKDSMLAGRGGSGRGGAGVGGAGVGGATSSNAGTSEEQGASGTPGAMGSAGEVAATAGQPSSGSSGSGPRDAGVMDAMTDPVPDAMADEPVSGSRLKARYLVGDDGSKQWNYGWYDTQRKENCAFGTAADGKTRCLPTAGGYAYGSYFADAACSQEVTGVGCSGPAPKYINVSHASTDGCTVTLASLHSAGAAYTGTMIYAKSGTTCTALTPSVGLAYYFIGDEVPASSFMAATEQVDM